MNYRFADTDTIQRKATSSRVKSVSMKNLAALEAVSATIDDARQAIAILEGQRDKLAAAARKDGYTWPAIAAAAHLSRQGAELVAKRANKGELPVPRQRG